MANSSAERKTCVSIYDRENPDSVYSRLPGTGRDAMDSIPSYLKTWSFKKIEKTFLHRFTTRDRIWKLAFWREYEHAIDNDKQMSPKAICRGVCPEDYMRDHIFKNNPLFAWILYPMPSYENSMTEMLDLSTRRLRDVLEHSPVHAKTGALDHKLISLQIKIHELVENRVRGVAPQILNINQRSLNMNVNKNSDDVGGGNEDLSRLSLPEVNQRLMEIQRKMKSLPDDHGLNKRRMVSSEKTRKRMDGEYYEAEVVENSDDE